MEAPTKVSVINLLLTLAGGWLMMAAYEFPYHFSGLPRVIEFCTGFLVFVLALICAVRPSASYWLSWVNVALGIWLFLAPLLLGYAYLDVALRSEIILGVIVAGLAFWRVPESRGIPATPR